MISTDGPELDAVDGSGRTNGLDITRLASSANYGRLTGGAANPYTQVDGDGMVTGIDFSHCLGSACFGL